MKRTTSNLILFAVNFGILFVLAALLIRSQQTAHGRNYPGDTFYGLWNFTQPPLTGWTWDNQGSSTSDDTYGYEYGSFLITSAVQERLRYRTAPSTPYTITAGILADFTGAVAFSGTAVEGGVIIGFRDGTGKLVDFLERETSASGAGSPNVMVNKWTSSTSFSANYQQYGGPAVGIWPLMGKQIYLMQISDDGTNLIFRLSVDGNHWKPWFQKSRTDWLASGPTQVFWGAYANTNQVEAALVSWQVTSP